MSTQTTARYTQLTAPAKIANLEGLIAFLKDHAPDLEGYGDLYGKTCRQLEWVSPSWAADCVAAIDALPPGEDPKHYVFLARQDMMCRPSFTWDLRQGGVPETGSSQTVAHHPIPLAPGRDYFLSFTHQGECEPLIEDGWSLFYYSDRRCRETVKSILPLVGKEWTADVQRVRNHQGVPQSLVVIFKSLVADKVSFSLTLAGQGKVRWIPDMLTAMQNGQLFFNVMDTYYNRVRSGTLQRDGTVWQYP